MEVDKDNLSEVIELVEKSIKRCDFVGMDMEMSGLTTCTEMGPHGMDTLQERWEKTKDSADNFAVLQVGICPCRWAKVDGQLELIAEPFNFWIYPGVCQGNSDSRLLFQTGSVEFLSSCEFDFNRSFRKGLAYMNQTEAREMRDKYNKKVTDLLESSSSSTSNSQSQQQQKRGTINPARLQDAAAKYLASATALAQKLQSGQSEELNKDEKGRVFAVLQPGNSFFRRLIYQEVPRVFPKIHVGKFPQDNPPQLRRGEGCLRLTLSSDAKDGSLDEIEKFRIEQETTEDRVKMDSAIGFSQVVFALKAAKKPIIGHNCLQDIAHLFGKFVQPLPQDLETFRSALHDAFPMIVDSKHMFSTNGRLQNLVPQNSLSQCFEATATGVFKDHNPRVFLGQGFKRYEFESHSSNAAVALHHEAGYDAFMTAVVFARGMCLLQMGGFVFDIQSGLFQPGEYSETPSTHHSSGEPMEIPRRPELFNKLYLMRLAECIDLTKRNEEKDRSLLLRLCNFHPFTKTFHIRSALTAACDVNDPRVIWDNDTSVFYFAPNEASFRQMLSTYLSNREPSRVGKVLDKSGDRMGFNDMDVVPFQMWKDNGQNDAYDYTEQIRNKFGLRKRPRDDSAQEESGDQAQEGPTSKRANNCVIT